MKTAIAYALLVIGIPSYLGLIAASALQIPIAWLTPQSKSALEKTRSLLWQSLESVAGFVAMLASLYLFKLLSASVGIAVPIILAVWITCYYFGFRQPKWEWICWLAGIVVGWIVLPSRVLG